MQALRWLFPSTAGIQASLRLTQMGAPLHDVLPYLGALAAMVVTGLLVLWIAATPRKAERI